MPTLDVIPPHNRESMSQASASKKQLIITLDQTVWQVQVDDLDKYLLFNIHEYI